MSASPRAAYTAGKRALALASALALAGPIAMGATCVDPGCLESPADEGDRVAEDATVHLANAIHEESPLGAPRDVIASAGRSLDAIRIEWQPPASHGPSALRGYVVLRYLGESLDARTELDATATTLEDDGVDPLRAYRYRVAAVNDLGEGPLSPPACASSAPWASASLAAPFPQACE